MTFRVARTAGKATRMADDRHKVRWGRIGVITVVGLAFTAPVDGVLLDAAADLVEGLAIAPRAH